MPTEEDSDASDENKPTPEVQVDEPEFSMENLRWRHFGGMTAAELGDRINERRELDKEFVQSISRRPFNRTNPRPVLNLDDDDDDDDDWREKFPLSGKIPTNTKNASPPSL